LEVVDGQQRLTTISLLFCSIYKLLKGKIENSDEELQNELFNLKYKIIQRRNQADLKMQLSEQNSNFSDYKSILAELEIITFTNGGRNQGNRRIYKTFRYFENKLQDYSVQELRDLLTKITSKYLQLTDSFLVTISIVSFSLMFNFVNLSITILTASLVLKPLLKCLFLF